MTSETRHFLEKLAAQHQRDSEYYAQQAKKIREILEKEASAKP